MLRGSEIGHQRHTVDETTPRQPPAWFPLSPPPAKPRPARSNTSATPKRSAAGISAINVGSCVSLLHLNYTSRLKPSALRNGRVEEGRGSWASWHRPVSPPTGSPEAVARPRFPQNVACGFPAPTLFGSCFTALQAPAAPFDSVESVPGEAVAGPAAAAQHRAPVTLHDPIYFDETPEISGDAVIRGHAIEGVLDSR
jgi:hypothetical protein